MSRARLFALGALLALFFAGIASSAAIRGDLTTSMGLGKTTNRGHGYGLTKSNPGTTTTSTTTTTPTPPPPLPDQPVYNKSSDNGRTIAQNWPNFNDNGVIGTLGTDGFQPQLIPDPAGSGRFVYAQTTTYPSDDSAGGGYQRVDLTDWTNFQHLGTNPDWTSSPFRTGQEWWFAWEVYYPSVNITGSSSVLGGPQTLGHFIGMGAEWNWHWQMHKDDIIQNGSPPYTQEGLIVGVLTDTATGANPRFRVYVRGGNLDNATSGGSGANANLVAGGGAISQYNAPSNSLVFDHWYRWVFHYYISNNNDGYLQAWLDGTKVIDMLAATPASWSKFMLNSSNVLVSQSAEQTQPTNFYRVTSVDSQGHTGTNGTQYPAIDNYHNRFVVNGSGTVNTSNVVVLHRQWLAGRSLASVGGL